MAITTVSSEVTAGKLKDRAEAFDIPAKELDGADVEIIWQTANEAIAKARAGEGPAFLLIKCKHFYGHFLGDPLLRIAESALKMLNK